MERYGLNVEIYIPDELCEKSIIQRYGIIEDDVIIIGKKA